MEHKVISSHSHMSNCKLRSELGEGKHHAVRNMHHSATTSVQQNQYNCNLDGVDDSPIYGEHVDDYRRGATETEQHQCHRSLHVAVETTMEYRNTNLNNMYQRLTSIGFVVNSHIHTRTHAHIQTQLNLSPNCSPHFHSHIYSRATHAKWV